MQGNPKRVAIANALYARLFPIRVYIGVLFAALVLGVGFSIGVYNYIENTGALLRTGNVLFERAREATGLTMANLFKPTEVLVNILSQHRLAYATDLEKRLQRLPYLIETLNQHPPLSALYVGYKNGDFFLVRPLRTELSFRTWAAPPAARYLVQHIQRNDAGKQTGTYLFFDASGRLIERREKPDYRFDPRTRPWYRLALHTSGTVSTEPYVFFSTHEPGVTLTRRTPDGRAVVGADITLDAVTNVLKRVKVTPSTELMLLDAHDNILAHSSPGVPSAVIENDKLRLPRLDDFRQSVLAELLRQPKDSAFYPFEYRSNPWFGAIDKFSIANNRLYLVMAAPRAELLADAERVRRNEAALTGVILLLSIPLVWLTGRWVSRPLQRLAEHTRLIQAFNFSQPIAPSWIKEVDQLAGAMDGMQRTISRFLDLSTALSSQQKLSSLLEQVLAEATATLRASGGSIYLVDDLRDICEVAVSHGNAPTLPHAISLAPGSVNDGDSHSHFADLCRTAIRSRTAQVSGLREEHQTSIVIPLFNRERDPVGLIALSSPVSVTVLSKEAVGFVEALSGTAAIAIEAQRSFETRKALLQSLIELIAAAIDAKSPHTSGHCQRVPVIANMLARAASESKDGPFQDFHLSEDEWEALHLGSWLHDCGKVTTPEYVVDKATKLEMLYDRIHEVRMRFEILKRDADIAYWTGIAGGGDAARLAAERDAAKQALDQDFAFIAQCNLGGETMSGERIERIKQIGRRTWLRTLDDRIGISGDECKRKSRVPAPPLPEAEPLLADRVDHLIERLPQDKIPPDNPWEFKLDEPKYKYNHGEIYNLSIGRGTLSCEERYKINDHVAQTYIMLSKLPFPKPLRDVPNIAGNHHEKIDGTGYPRRLRKEQMSVSSRMIVIADIFEALTAADRPYKYGKPLSETLDLMARMRDEQHIDAELFELFLRSGVYRAYAQQYLTPEQMDVDDIRQFVQG